MRETPKRPRIGVTSKGQIVESDPVAFVKNKCSNNAKKIDLSHENIQIELWFDKHYHDRHQHGDENGKRDGIDPSTVVSLVKKSLPYLLLYGSLVRGFKFVNHPSSDERGVKIILQQIL